MKLEWVRGPDLLRLTYHSVEALLVTACLGSNYTDGIASELTDHQMSGHLVF